MIVETSCETAEIKSSQRHCSQIKFCQENYLTNFNNFLYQHSYTNILEMYILTVRNQSTVLYSAHPKKQQIPSQNSLQHTCFYLLTFNLVLFFCWFSSWGIQGLDSSVFDKASVFLLFPNHILNKETKSIFFPECLYFVRWYYRYTVEVKL